MKQTITLSNFRDAFQRVRPDNFSYEGLEVLFDYLEQYEQGSGQEIELDVISLCCDYSESLIEDVLKEYNLESLEELESETMVLKVDDETVIYQNY